ncbi:hypothetical protein KDH_47720 [Dictyobacter sp. S3.2.2.5]|uniref:Methyltransferase domain-containing protein n=1 Tax=Dictyobacter halimunensis TaxID=3026934 RepID=A0ABQ6FUK4_9CHLR|nr:hypothetical protein KDH_47720 [Dictyobacter sp. S3.2.2.5]
MRRHEDEVQELLKRVREWFNASEQVEYYQREVKQGLTASEAWLLQSLPPQGKILDIGCGAGRASIEVARRGLDVVGVDVSPGLVDSARAAAVAAKVSAQFLCMEDGRTLPFSNSSFDAALAFKVYCYLPSQASRLTYLAEVFRVLRPGASLFLTSYIVPDDMFYSYVDDETHALTAALFDSLEPGDTFASGQGYVHWFTSAGLKEELSRSPFQLDLFQDDEEVGGNGLHRLVRLTSPPTS